MDPDQTGKCVRLSWVDDMGSLRVTLGPSSTSRKMGLPPAHCPLAHPSRADGVYLRLSLKEGKWAPLTQLHREGGSAGSSRVDAVGAGVPDQRGGPVPPILRRCWEGPGVWLRPPHLPPFSPGGPSFAGMPLLGKEDALVSGRWKCRLRPQRSQCQSEPGSPPAPPTAPRSQPFWPRPSVASSVNMGRCRGAATAGTQAHRQAPARGVPGPRPSLLPAPCPACGGWGPVAASPCVQGQPTKPHRWLARTGRGTRAPRFPVPQVFRHHPRVTQMRRKLGAREESPRGGRRWPQD